ncbi:uncharacterized protein LOC122360089 [Puntigrus tetrazona]|uniref:uncharacterized protein LOC122360089 n=1 Tax=Puntigrus tetrazona TaxID=1606681 RepID=UPI001C8A82BB|nr:uncharacterized protein LOC122360089 [Puntigrus tetrazona]
MRTFRSLHLQLLYLLITALLECKAQKKQVLQLNINSFRGDNMSISCLTTTHPLESLTVKLRSIKPVKDILVYPDISPASEHQRWSVRKEAGNVTLDLKDIRLTDDGLYDCQVYKDQDCLHATQFNLKVKECEKLNPVHATFNSSVLLQCIEHPRQNMTHQVTWKVIVGHQLTDITRYPHSKNPSSGTEKRSNPLYERARQLVNGSLLIRNAVHDDELWYQCRLDEKSCFELKLLIKGAFPETLSTTLEATVSADSPLVQGESDINESESETASLSAVVLTTVVSLCLLMLLTICLILYFKKRRCKTNSQTQLSDRFSVNYSEIVDGFGVPFYSLIEQNTATMCTFVPEQSEAPACKPDNTYETSTGFFL